MDTKKGKGAKRPSRALTAYNFYFHDHRQRIQESLFQTTGRRPTYTEISRHVGAGWKKLSAQERAHYEALAERDKRRYALQLVEFKTGEESSTTSVSGAPAQTLATTAAHASPNYSGNGQPQAPVVNPFSPSLQMMLQQSFAGHQAASTSSFPIDNPVVASQLYILSLMMIDYVRQNAPEKLSSETASTRTCSSDASLSGTDWKPKED
jgi:hypothetical protein